MRHLFSHKAILALLCPSVFFATCRKDEAPPANTTAPPCNCSNTHSSFVDTFLIRKFIFNSGTYWVFHDSLNNVDDSVYNNGPESRVVGYWSGTVGCNCYHSFRYVTNNNSNTAYWYNYNITGSLLEQYAVNYQNYTAIILKSQNDSITTVPGVLYNATYIGNYSVGSLNFDSVYKSKVFSQMVDSGTVYLRANVGLLRTEIYQGGVKKVYKLLRYQIQ